MRLGVAAAAAAGVVLLLLAALPGAQPERIDYYEVLGVERDASTMEVRRAFKKLALIRHPDKNPDKPDAQAEFVLLNRAYEVLKDGDLRKRYDRFGEEGLKDDFAQRQQHQQHGWGYFKNEFGLYDDDEGVETFVDGVDFDEQVMHGGERWFVKFYSPGCSHCHDMAGAWRELANELAGVIGIGAINCQEHWMLCQQMGIRAFPTLLLFGGDGPSTVQTYRGPRSAEHMAAFVTEAFGVPVRVPETELARVLEHSLHEHWLLAVCQGGAHSRAACVGEDELVRAQIMLGDSVRVGLVVCESSDASHGCGAWGLGDGDGDGDGPAAELRMLPKGRLARDLGAVVHSDPGHLTARQLGALALSSLPALPALALDQLASLAAGGTVVLFHDAALGRDGESEALLLDRALRQLDLGGLGLQVAQVDCSPDPQACVALGVKVRPQLRLFKAAEQIAAQAGGPVVPSMASEVYYGASKKPRALQRWLQSAMGANIVSLTAEDFDAIFAQGWPAETWFIDFFAPWCPPCQRMLPVFHEAAAARPGVRFATIDCTVEGELCQREHIRGYPTAMLLARGTRHDYGGDTGDLNGLLQHLDDVLDPVLLEVTPANFDAVVYEAEQQVVVAYVAPWCGPCQALKPVLSAAARELRGLVPFATVDCQAYGHICQHHGVRGYPTVRLYTTEHGQRMNTAYRGFRQTDALIRFALSRMRSAVTHMDAAGFRQIVAHPGSGSTWLVVFGTPWCRPCQHFKGTFEALAQLAPVADRLDVRFAEVDCQQHGALCHSLSIPSYPYMALYVDGQVAGSTQEQDLGWLRGWLADSVGAEHGGSSVDNPMHDEL